MPITKKEKIAILCFAVILAAAYIFGPETEALCRHKEGVRADSEEMRMWLCLK